MKKAIFCRMVLLCAVALLIAGLVSTAMLSYNYQTTLRQKATAFLDAADQIPGLSADPAARARELSLLYDNSRVTIIAPNGRVLGDSQVEAAAMDNHGDRPEVRGALGGGQDWSLRRSDTLGSQMLYVARRSADGSVLRIQLETGQRNEILITQLPALIAGLLLALAVAAWMAGHLSSKLIEPVDDAIDAIRDMESGQYGQELPLARYEEFAPLTAHINSLSNTIQHSLSTLSQERDKLSFLLDSMRQGVVVVNWEMKIVLCNSSAARIFQATGSLAGKPMLMLTHDPGISSRVKRCVDSGAASVFDISFRLQERIYSISVNPVSSQWLERGAMIILTDVTETRNAEELRRQFVANASHELKTPVTSIRGFAELLASGMVTQPSQVQDYLGRIQSESARMDNLVSDILGLSALEDKRTPKNIEHLELRGLAAEVTENLQPQAARHQVALELLDGGPVKLEADRDDMRRLLQNLAENAVKYNRPGGKVTLSLEKKEERTVLIVKDTGIGISQADIPRIFERFYRVDKGRSRAVEGTGLGLSIVKHLVASYGGTIEVKSQLGQGTEIIVTL